MSSPAARSQMAALRGVLSLLFLSSTCGTPGTRAAAGGLCSCCMRSKRAFLALASDAELEVLFAGAASSVHLGQL